MIVWLVGWLLTFKLSAEDKNKIVIHILDNLQAKQLGAIIDTNEDGELTISGKTVDIEKASQLRAHARSGLENKALNLIREQVVYETFTGAATKAITGEDLLFYRAALWYGQQVEKHLKLLAGRQEEPALE